MKSILDRSFRYTPSAQTDLRQTFARIRSEQHPASNVPIRAVPNASALSMMPNRVRESSAR